MATALSTKLTDLTTDAAIPLVRPQLPSLDAMREDLEAAVTSGMVTKGPFLERLESEIAEHLGVKHAVAVSSCTTGLLLTYMGLGLTDEVIVPSFTFMATVGALVRAGLRPVFCDVDPDTHTIDPDAVRELITSRTSAIVGVHCFGNPADEEALQRIAREYGLKLVFDAAHGFGALHQGQPLGRRGDASVFSLSPTKLLIAGEGGIVATNDDALAQAVRMGREYGNDGRYNSVVAGINARMPEMSAVMAIHSLRLLEGAARHRNHVATFFRRELGQLPGIGFQVVRPGDRCSYKDFSITVDACAVGLTRDDLVTRLAHAGVDTRRYYDPPVHRHTAYAHFHDGRPLPVTDELARTSVSLPIWSHMDEITAARIVGVVSAACGER